VTGKETINVYVISGSPPPATNYSSTSQMWDFTLDDQPDTNVYFFGAQTQRVPSYPDIDDKSYTLLYEQLFLSVLDRTTDTIIGFVNATLAYPDQGTSDITSAGQFDYRVFSASGIFEGATTWRTTFFSDGTRRISIIG